jgi:hypothetical protein
VNWRWQDVVCALVMGDLFYCLYRVARATHQIETERRTRDHPTS